MRIQKLQLKNFKRFTDLTLDGIPVSAKLVLLIGANGSGKTSVFDAFDYINKQYGHNRTTEPNNYYSKNKNARVEFEILCDEGRFARRFNNDGGTFDMGHSAFIGRSSLRIVPKIQEISYNESTIKEDIDAPKSYIDYDTRFNADVIKYTFDINKALREPAFKGQSADTVKIFQEHIVPFNTALKNIFPQSEETALQLVQFEDALPGQPIKLIFKKGGSHINYDLLSHGEKQVVIILLNFLVRKEQIKDSIYFIDEMDAHLNTALQFNLLKEITENWVPDDAQLWTASHSLGFIDYARQSDYAVILDFDDLNFDIPQVIVPEPKDRMEVYEIAVGKDMLARLFQGMNIIFVENKDDQYYNNVALSNTIFVPENNKAAVYHKARASEFKGIVDRDFLTDEEVVDIETTYPNLKILRYYSIENYLYHPDNLAEYYSQKDLPFDLKHYKAQLTVEKNAVVGNMVTGLAPNRMSYPFYGEQEKAKDVRQRWFKNTGDNQQHATVIWEYLRSDDFETFYKVFPMKNNATQLPQRQNIPPSDLTKTTWFKEQIQRLVDGSN
ncbi:MAG: AAA family ATPase [Bacteroidetes bacterium]|nr:AAA family ATPase [Bacteroidota bacterium]